ncbi:hypothetical protein C7451_10771 [Blastomonas natatoria]|uniref:Uncharacterized protein n=1 Tax=Blastomonas natatoria TaxID=34015 RepID=A0A2V3V045_9SPHN|nr:hypothetical protein [Blastomonas natatoria]PXW75102.1 hypothetical protein C7451_10771 [Blastomonas natatoria]
MINNSDPPGSPTMRTVYIRPNYQANDVAPRNTDPAPARPVNDGVINLVNRPTAPSGAMESLAKAAGSAELPKSLDDFARQVAQSMLGDPEQAMRTLRPPTAEVVTGLLSAA